MFEAEVAFQDLINLLIRDPDISAGQMFGKACLKVKGKAFVAQHKDRLIFKLSGPEHRRALSLSEAKLWDPSGKGKPMKDWVALGVQHTVTFNEFAQAAQDYCRSLT